MKHTLLYDTNTLVIAYSGIEGIGLFYSSTKFTKLDFDTEAEMLQYIENNHLEIVEVEDVD